jgi:Fic family protein
MKALDDKSIDVLNFVKEHPSLSSKEIHDGLTTTLSYATTKRVLSKLVTEQLIKTVGIGRGRKYNLDPAYELFYPIDVNHYFEKEIDERDIKGSFNLALITNILDSVKLFSKEELEYLERLHIDYKNKVAELTDAEYSKELERLAIDLSWKSSQIEGNTYSLLETELLIKEKQTAKGKGKDEATMLLNHKYALDFIIDHPDYLEPLTIARIEDIHSLLVKDLGIDKNVRLRRVGISGTNYTPLDNEHQIKEALQSMCDLINQRENVFEKTLLLLVLISYIQPFGDGNKRTARIVSNAMLIYHGYCPLSFRTIDSIAYKEAMLIFYERNNITAFKDIFINQFAFAVKTYF